MPERQAQEDGMKISGDVEKDEAVDLGAAAGGDQRSHLTIEQFRQQLQAAVEEVKQDKEIWAQIVSKICSFGPRRVGPNLLIDDTGEHTWQTFLI